MLRRQPNPVDFVPRLEGRVVRSLARRGKFLMFDLGEDHTWVSHLGMSGRMSITRPDRDLAPPHQGGHRDRPRRGDPDGGPTHFRIRGRLHRFRTGRLPPWRALGPDALTELPPTGWMAEPPHGAAGSAIKTLLLDQRFIAGLGNIYTDEILYEAGVDGSRPAGCAATRRNGVHQEIHPLRPRGRAGARWNLTRRPGLPTTRREGRPSPGVPGRVRTRGPSHVAVAGLPSAGASSGAGPLTGVTHVRVSGQRSVASQVLGC